jgi:hypothetical protein
MSENGCYECGSMYEEKAKVLSQNCMQVLSKTSVSVSQDLRPPPRRPFFPSTLTFYQITSNLTP